MKFFKSYLALASASSWPLLDTSSKPPIRCLKELQHTEQTTKQQHEQTSLRFILFRHLESIQPEGGHILHEGAARG